MIPSRRLVLLALVPLALALATLARPSLLWAMAACDGALLALAAIDALLARGRLVTVERRCPDVLSVGRPNPVVLEVRSHARRRLVLAVTDDLFEGAESSDLPVAAALPPGGSDTLRYHVRPTRRGAYRLGAHHVRYPSPLGLWQRQLRIPAEQPVKVYPDLQLIRTWELLAHEDREHALVRAVRQRGGESEFERLRDYLKDDEFRNIDWKATARRQKLIAREYQVERNQSIIFLLDCGRLMTAHGKADGLSHLDHALNAMLMLAHVALRAGDQVGLIAFDDQVRRCLPPTGGARAGQRLIQASYHLHPSLVETDYRAALDQLSLRMRKRALIVLFTQVIDEHSAGELAHLVRALRPRHLPLPVLFRDEEIDALVEPPPGARPEAAELDLYLRGAAAEFVAWRDRLLRQLRAQGVLTVDTTPGRLTPSLLNRYLEIKARQLL